MRSGRAVATAAVMAAASSMSASRMVARPGRGPGAPPRGRTSANTSTSGCSAHSISSRGPPTKPWAPVTRPLTANQPVGGRSAVASSALAVVAPVVLAEGGVRFLERPPPRLVLPVPGDGARQSIRERHLRLPAHLAQLPAVEAVPPVVARAVRHALDEPLRLADEGQDAAGEVRVWHPLGSPPPVGTPPAAPPSHGIHSPPARDSV